MFEKYIILLCILISFLFILYNIKEELFDNNTVKIPKIIHQIWIGPKSPPIKFMKQWENDYIKMYPDFKYIFWNEDKIEKDLKWPKVIKQAYDKETTYFGKSDIARLLILNQYGGIYIDSDSIWVNNKNLDDLITQAYNEKTNIFAGIEPGEGGRIANGVIGSSINNKSLLFVIDCLQKICENYDELRSKTPVWQLTGPVLVNKAVVEKYPFTVLPEKIFYPYRWHNLTKEIVKQQLLNLPKESYMYQFGYSTNADLNLD